MGFRQLIAKAIDWRGTPRVLAATLAGLSFAFSSFGDKVANITDPTAFAKALESGTRYNSESLTTPYWKQVENEIAAVQAIIAACLR
ncbi:MAG: hypothetical protein ACRD3S_17180 [Terracidiphilus sp.]